MGARVVWREYHIHVVFAHRREDVGCLLLDGECAGDDGIRALDLYHAANKPGGFVAVGFSPESPTDKDRIIGKRKLALLPPEHGKLRDLRLGRVSLQRDLDHASEIGALGDGEILLQFGAVDLTVDGLLLIRIGVVARFIPFGDDRHTVVHPGFLGFIFIAHRKEVERIREVQLRKGRADLSIVNVSGVGIHIFAGNDVHVDGAFRCGVLRLVVGREDDLEPQRSCLQVFAVRQQVTVYLLILIQRKHARNLYTVHRGLSAGEIEA